ncbi:MAG: XRE family transcriptional regulator [Candidatus Cybelea sp.]
MARKFAELEDRMTPAQRERSDAKAREMLAQIRLQELRQARSNTQKSIAEIMHVPQSAVSKIESRTDAYVSTIRRYLQAMGGELEIVARFPDGETYEITQFHEIGDLEPDRELVIA